MRDQIRADEDADDDCDIHVGSPDSRGYGRNTQSTYSSTSSRRQLTGYGGDVTRLRARDALMYWMSAKLPNDQFLLYCFDSPTLDSAELRSAFLQRARRIADLNVRVKDVPWNLDYPHWVPREIVPTDVVVQRPADSTWSGCLARIGGLLATTVDPTVSPWRLHVFTDVRDAPECTGPAVVVVLQISHALVDGQGSAMLARALFGPDESVDFVRESTPSAAALVAESVVRAPVQFGRMIAAGVKAGRAYRESVALAERGELPPKMPGRELVAFNRRPDGPHSANVVVVPLAALRSADFTVTIVALTALSVAISTYLRDCGAEVPDRLGAEVTVAHRVGGTSRNSYSNVGVGLFPHEPDLAARARLIKAELAQRRIRAAHPSITTQGQSLDATPAAFVRTGVVRFDLSRTPATVSGNTVLTSIDRGPANLRFGGGPVRFTAGFPALSPAMGVTHGIYTIGDTLALCIHSSPAALPDAHSYESLIRKAIAEAGQALRITPKR